MIGAGSWAGRHLQAWQQGGVGVIAIYNRTRPRAEKLAKDFDIPDIYSDTASVGQIEEYQ